MAVTRRLAEVVKKDAVPKADHSVYATQSLQQRRLSLPMFAGIDVDMHMLHACVHVHAASMHAT